MKKLFTYFFVTLGVIFFVLLCALAYVWFADPFNIRPMIQMLTSDTQSTVQAEKSNTTTPSSSSVTPDSSGTLDKHPALSAEQESTLESVGINPANLPSSITPAMEACFVAKLGESRVAEIKTGVSPTPSEVFTTRECYQ
jgi:hypothetical protein